MVNAGGRSKWNKAKGSDGSNASSNSGRLKKGGKRRKRPCYKEGCTLCPSFGYEGRSVALSCSRHKKKGMLNLTARRCQHEGCFTAANFGIPGDKPRFCLAHSTEGMVNRNKPRGGEGMGMIASRSSRRTTKANNSFYDGNNTNNEGSGMLKAETWADAQEPEGFAGVGNCPVSGGGDIIMYVGGAEERCKSHEGDHYGALSSRALRNVTSRDFESGRVTVGDYVASVEHGSPVSSMELTSKGDKSNGVMSHKHTSSSMSVCIPTPPCEAVSAAFVSWGDGLDGLAGGPEGKPPGGIIGGRNRRRERSGNVEEGLGPATVPREPYRQDDFIVAPRVETDDFEKHLPSNGRDVPEGVPDRRGVVNAPLNLSVERNAGNSGGIMNGGGRSFFMGGSNGLDDGDEEDSDMGFQIGATLEDILGVGRDDDETEDFDPKGCCDEGVFREKCLGPSANASAMRSSAGLSLNSNRCINFEIDHLSELNSVFLSGVHAMNSGQDIRPQQQQGHYLCSGASGIRVTSDIGDMSSLTPSASSSVDAAVRSISTPVTPTPGTPVAPDALISPKHPVEQVWWNGLEGKDVAMSEIVWESTAEEQEVASTCGVIRFNIYHDHDNLGEGDRVAPGESTGSRNGSMGVGEACLNPPQKRHRYSPSDNDQHVSLPTHLGSTPLGNRSIKQGDISLFPTGNFSPPSGSQHSTVPSSPVPAEFGLTVVPSSSISRNGSSSSSSGMTVATSLTHAGQINMKEYVSIAVKMPRSSSGAMGGSEQGDGGNMGLGNRRIPSGNSMGNVLLNGEHVCLGQPGFVGASYSLPVHVAMGS